MTIFGSNKDDILKYIEDASNYGIKVITPDINKSQIDFSILDDNTIIYGFGSVKGLPDKAIDVILERRPFTNIEDIVSRSQKNEVNKRAVDALVWSGAIDTLDTPDRLKALKIFYETRGDKIDELPDTIPNRYILNSEKDILGIYISGHPLEVYEESVDWEKVKESGERITVYGIISSRNVILTKKGDLMAFVDIEFQNEYLNGVMFPNTFNKEVERRKGSKLTPLGRFVEEDVIVKVSAYFNEDYRGGQSFVIADMMVPVGANKEMEEELVEIEEAYGRDPEVIIEEERPAPRVIDFNE